jgi:hypothetical protein
MTMSNKINRTECVTSKVDTPFGPMYIHLDIRNDGFICEGSISHPLKEPDSSVSELIENLSHGLNSALHEAYDE